MNRLTIIGYLKNYFQQNLNTKTLSINKLMAMCDDNTHLVEYVALYATLTGKDYLCAKKDNIYRECLKIKESSNIAKISPKYKRIYKEYEALADTNPDDDFKKTIRNRIIEIQSDKKITNYRIYTDLSLNPGNVNSFLKNGECKKLSLDVIRRIWKYVERI